MLKEIILYGYYDEIDKNIKKFKRMFLIKTNIAVVKNGYLYNDKKDNIYIGQKILVSFDDTFNKYKIEMYVVDILVELKENFGILLVPENYENMFPGQMNVFLKTFNIDSLRSPKDGCFFAKHLGNGTFSFEIEKKIMKDKNNFEINIVVPKLFTIPKQTIERLNIYKHFSNKKLLPFGIERIIKNKEKK